MTEHSGDPLRLSVNERIQHAVLMLCVIVLVTSGLALRFADTWFGRAVIALEGGMEVRGFLHRAAAVGLMLLWAYHALYAVFTRRGHDQLMAVLPRIQDVRDLVTSLRYNLGAGAEAPRFARFDFRQKFQYWAVALGVWSMTVTGLALWFESAAMAVMPKWVFDVAQVLHGGEGVLIFVVLFVWHIYDTHLRPGVFPMDRTWLTGRLTTEEMKLRYPLEFERLGGAPDEQEAQ